MNICRYAYPATPGEVTVRLHAAAGSFRIALTDNGVPFNPLAADEPDIHAALADRKVGGLGIYFIRKVIDEVQYQRVDDRNILTLVMRLGQEGEPCNGSHGIG
ncbi:MAG: Serine/threonine-protein kinase BtrW [bacterium ADurb.Bin429]|nr:MAG: Serine/threonine-protein kinase BtrW [bacterium ADurb.Bin429]